MIDLQFTVPGIPRAPLLPKETVEFQTRVSLFAQLAMNDEAPMGGVLSVDLLFVFPAPMRSLKRAQRDQIKAGEMLVWHRIQKDIDNLCKSTLDGLKGVAIQDDRYVVNLTARKRIAAQPRTVITITQEKP